MTETDEIEKHTSLVETLQQERKEDEFRSCTGLLTFYHGVAYQVQWMMLVALEAKDSETVNGFKFRTEVDYKDSGKFDDVVWQYYSNEYQKLKYNFLQAKHKLHEDTETITIKDLLKKGTQNNPFGLVKYYVSYKDGIQNNRKYKNGIIDNLIIATNVDFDKDLKCILSPVNNVNSILNIICESEEEGLSPTCWKIESNLNEENYLKIVENLEDTYDLIKLAKKLEKIVFNHQEFVLPSDLQVYNEFILQNVFNYERTKISYDFIHNHNLLDETKKFREAFFHEAFVKKRKLLHVSEDGEDISEGNDFAKFIARKIADSKNNTVKLIMRKNRKDNIHKLSNFVLIKKDGIKFNPKFWTQQILYKKSLKNFRTNIIKELKKCGILGANDHSSEISDKLDIYRFEIKNFTTCKEHLIDEDSFWSVVGDYTLHDKNESCRNNDFLNFPEDSIHIIQKDIVKFFNILVFAVNYTKKHLDEVIAEKLNKNFKWIGNEFTAYAFRSEIAKALDLTENKFISTDEEVSQFFDKVAQQSKRFILLGPTLEYCTKIETYKIFFQPNVISKHPLHTFLNDESQDLENHQLYKTNSLEYLSKKQVFCIRSEEKMLSAVKVFHILKKIPKYNDHKGYIFMRLETLLNLQEYAMQVFDQSNHLLIIECDLTKDSNSSYNLYDKISKVLRRDIKKKVLLISHNENILIKNFRTKFARRYYEMIDSEIGFLSLDNNTQISILKKSQVVFQGINVSMEKLIGDSYHFIDSQILSQILNHDKLEICDNLLTLEDYFLFYVPRELICRKKVIAEILKDKSTDLFAVSRIDEHELEKLAIQYKSNTSKIYKFNLDEFKDEEVKFVILSEPLEEDQFSKLSKIYPNRNIHWLIRENDYFQWRLTKGTFKNLRRYLDIRKYYKEAIEDENCDTEIEIFEILKSERIVIITAEPGMGKSTMITHIALSIKKQDPSIWLVIISLLNFRSQLEKVIVNNIDSAMNFFYTTVGFSAIQNHKLKDDETKIKGFSLLEIGLFKKKLYQQNQVYIVLDGFDEICPELEIQITYLINVLRETTLANVWITSRNYNIIDDLEDKLGTLSYLIKPFGENEQRMFLFKFWKSCVDICDFNDQRATIFMNELLAEFSNSTNDTNRTFIGIPLQLKMLAQTCLTIFKEYTESESLQVTDELKQKISKRLNLANLYEEFIAIKFDEIRFKEKKPDYPSFRDREIKKIIELEREEFLKEHKILAFRAMYANINNLFPEVKEMALSILPKIEKAIDKNAIIDKVIDSNPIFVHQTYAEYFAALFIWDKFKTYDYDPLFFKELVNLFLNFGNGIQVCTFFYFIADKSFKDGKTNVHKAEEKICFILSTLYPLVKSIYGLCRNTGGYLEKGIDDLEFSRYLREANTEIYAKNPDYVQVVKQIFKIIDSFLYVNKSVNKEFKNIIKMDESIDFLRLASEIGCANFIKVYKTYKVYDYKECLRRNKWYFNPLYLAAKNGHLDAVQMLSDVIKHNWVDKEKRTLTEFSYSYKELNVVKNCLFLNIFDANPFCNSFQLPIVKALELKWPKHVIKLLVEKTDVNIFNNFICITSFKPIKASFHICKFLLNYDLSITKLMIKKGMSFSGAINFLLQNFIDICFFEPVNDLRYTNYYEYHLDLRNGNLNLFELIKFLLSCGIGYNNLDDIYKKTTTQYSKDIYIMHKLLQNLSNYNSTSNIMASHTFLKVIIDTFACSEHRYNYKITKNRHDLLLEVEGRPLPECGSFNTGYNISLQLISRTYKNIFMNLSKSTNFIKKKLNKLKSYLGRSKRELEQFKKHCVALSDDIIGEYKEMIEFEFSVDFKILKAFRSLTSFQKLVLDRILYLYIRQNYKIYEAFQEVSRKVRKYKIINKWMNEKPEKCSICYEKIVDIFNLKCDDDCQKSLKQEVEEPATFFFNCADLIRDVWSAFSYVGEKHFTQVTKTMSKYINISSKILELLNRLDINYVNLTVAIKSRNYKSVCTVLKNIDNLFVKSVINGQDEVYGSPLHYASYIGDTQIVQELLSLGADPNLPLYCDSKLIGGDDNDCSGYKALQIAKTEKHLDITQLLLEAMSNNEAHNKSTPENIIQKGSDQNMCVPEFGIDVIKIKNSSLKCDEIGRKRNRSPTLMRQNSDDATTSKMLKNT